MNAELEDAKRVGREARRNGQPADSNPYLKPVEPIEQATKFRRFRPGGPSRGFAENWAAGWAEEDATMNRKDDDER